MSLNPDEPSHQQFLAGDEAGDRKDGQDAPETRPEHPTEPREQTTPYDHIWYRRRPQE